MQQASANSRQPYEAPQATDFGSVRTLTRALSDNVFATDLRFNHASVLAGNHQHEGEEEGDF